MQIHNSVNRASLLACAAAALAMSSLQPHAIGAQRPLEDFLSRQGRWCVAFDDAGNFVCPSEYGDLGCGFLFVPPSPNFTGWSDPKGNMSVVFDYAGLEDIVLGGTLGTTITGSINERPLADGRAEVSVVIHAHNALVWAIEGFDYANGPLLFGARPADVLKGATPSLGDCSLFYKFINSAPGAPLPDVIELGICRAQDLKVTSFTGQSSGLLADGTHGRLEVIQTGLVATAAKANAQSRVALDAFPAEYIHIQATGK